MEQPAPCPHPGSRRQEQTKDEEEQNTSEAQKQTVAVDRFRGPLLIVIGRHECYFLSKDGNGTTCSWRSGLGRASPQVLETAL